MVWSWKWSKWRLYLSDCRMRPRPPHEHTTRAERREFGRWKQSIVEKRGGVCERCGKNGGCALELHHILSRAKFPQLVDMEENIMVLCHECHKEIHCNPFLNAALMERKAAELHVDLTQLKIKN